MFNDFMTLFGRLGETHTAQAPNHSSHENLTFLRNLTQAQNHSPFTETWIFLRNLHNVHKCSQMFLFHQIGYISLSFPQYMHNRGEFRHGGSTMQPLLLFRCLLHFAFEPSTLLFGVFQICCCVTVLFTWSSSSSKMGQCRFIIIRQRSADADLCSSLICFISSVALKIEWIQFDASQY